jgi:hypothetical protein
LVPSGSSKPGVHLRPAAFWPLVVIQLWLAHAVGFFIHEYAHSFTAWLFHYKANPLAINYEHLNLGNVLVQADIDENVDYGPIFADGRGPLASLIALAGVLIGNEVSYLASRLLYAKAKQKEIHAWSMFFYWICVMIVGNFLCYVPIRTFTTHGDMATAARDLGVSSWLIAIVLGVPFAVALWHLFAKILPDAEAFLLPSSLSSERVFVLITMFFIFDYFGNAGLHGYGTVSHWLSITSTFILFPVVSVACWPRSEGRGAAEHFR